MISEDTRRILVEIRDEIMKREYYIDGRVISYLHKAAKSLSPCPLCGAPARFSTPKSWSFATSNRFMELRIHCSRSSCFCGIGPAVYQQYHNDSMITIKEAVKTAVAAAKKLKLAWNTRYQVVESIPTKMEMLNGEG